MWTAGANACRKQENSFYLELYLYEVYLVLPEFIMFKQYDCPRWNFNFIVLNLHVGDLISLKGFHIVCTLPPPFLIEGGGGGRGLNLLPNFQKAGAWQDLNFERGLLEKRGLTFFRGRLQFYKRNKLKSEIFNDKKSL